MTDPLIISVPGIPVSRQAHRFVNRKIYLPKDSRDYQQLIAQYAYKAMSGAPPINVAVFIKVLFVFPAPLRLKAADVKLIREGKLLVDEKIVKDVDNLCKNLLDGLKGVAIDDDRLVVDLYARKRIGLKPMTQIEIIREIP